MRIFVPLLVACVFSCFAGCGSSTETTPGNGGATTTGTSGKDPAVASKAAIFIGSCLVDDGINRTLNRMYTRRGSTDSGDQALLEHISCFKTKTNGCQAVKDCLGATVDLTGPCQASCNGDVFQDCDDALKYVIDCTVLGLTCSVEASGCIHEPLGATCDVLTYVPTCQNGAPVWCNDHVATGPTCADFGLTCGTVPGVPEFATCIGTGPSCTSNSLSAAAVEYDQGIACKGAALRACIADREQEVDCSSLASGFTCQTFSGEAFCGLDDACAPGSGAQATCDGDSVVICNGGKIEEVDCKSLGFTGCNAQYGVCVPSVYPGL